MKFDAVLRSWKEFFEREGIRYALAGGLAMHAWGHSRFTHDVDFIVDGTQQARAIAFAESLGYQTFHSSEGYSNHDHPDQDFGRVDLIYLYGTTADTIFAAAEPRASFGGMELPVADAEHLIAMKLAAVKNAPRRMPIDMPDVEYLMSLPGIDRAKVREYFAKNGLLRIFDVIETDRHR